MTTLVPYDPEIASAMPRYSRYVREVTTFPCWKGKCPSYAEWDATRTDISTDDLSRKIARLAELAIKDGGGDKLRHAIFDMGPGCLFDDPKNDDQRYGAALVLNWLQSYLEA